MDQLLILLNGFYFLYITGMGVNLLKKRTAAVSSGQLSGQYFKAYQGTIPESLKVLENHHNNQFQMPLYFTATSAVALAGDRVSATIVLLGVLFVISRIAHTWAHLWGNNVLSRAGFYFCGVLTIAAMWITLIVQEIG